MIEYLNLLENVLETGSKKEDRTGTGTISVFKRDLSFDLRMGFPAVTTKRLWMKGVVHELIWFLGNHLKDEKYSCLPRTNIQYLKDNKVNIWNEWATPEGNLGPVYGHQWRAFPNFVYVGSGMYGEPMYENQPIDQIANLIHDLKTNPDSRRLMVMAWNPSALEAQKLPPCHYGFQCYSEIIDGERHLSLEWQQRSVDCAAGLPFNIASYGVLLHMLAQITGHKVKTLSCSLGDTHIYSNHVNQVKEQLTREPYALPILKLNPSIDCIDDFKFDDVELENYKCHPTIPLTIAI